MGRSFAAVQLALSAVMIFFAQPAQAESCQLKEVASLDVVADSDGNPLVPMNIENSNAYFIFNPSMPTSIITRSAANSLNLQPQTIPGWMSVNYNGSHAGFVGNASIKIGNASGDTLFAILDGNASNDPKTAGILAYDVLRKFDIELDLAHNKINLFSQDHCPGQVIYWTRTAAVAAVPMKTVQLSELNIPVQIDGKDVNAQISTTAPYTLLHRHIARLTFGMDDPDKSSSQNNDNRTDDLRGDQRKPYAFHTLSLEGITISNPVIYPYGRDSYYICNGSTHEEPPPPHSEMRQLVTCFGEAEAYLGRSVLQKLRIFLALKERMLYATAANAQ